MIDDKIIEENNKLLHIQDPPACGDCGAELEFIDRRNKICPSCFSIEREKKAALMTKGAYGYETTKRSCSKD